MSIKRLHAFCVSALLSWHACVAIAQDAAGVSQVLPFASQGTLAIVEKAAAETATTSGGAATANPANVNLAQAGASISTGEGGASSLILGTVGAARMEADTEVKVPAATEKDRSLELLKGRLFLNINGEDLKKRGAGEFKLKTPAALLAVKGTKFFAISSADTDIIGVHHGTVIVTETQSGQSVSVEAGHAVTVSPGLLGETRALSETEGKLSLEYDLANLTVVAVPSIVYQDKPQPQALLHREGKVVTTPLPEHRFHNLEAHLWWPYSYSRQTYHVGNLDISPEGFVRYVWRVAAADKGRKVKTGTVDTSLSVSLRGQSLECFPNTQNQKPLLKVAALRFRMRISNVKKVEFRAPDLHTSAGLSEKQPNTISTSDRTHAADSRYAYGSMPLFGMSDVSNGVWHNVLLPVKSGDYGGVVQAYNNLLLKTTVQLEDGASSLLNKNPSLLEMKDFELLVVP